MMKTGPTPAEECFAVFIGDDGEEYERELAAGVFEKGKSYRVTSRIMYRWSTALELDGVDGEWNPRLFKGDLSKVPLRKELGYRPPHRVSSLQRNRIVFVVGIFVLAVVLSWIWLCW